MRARSLVWLAPSAAARASSRRRSSKDSPSSSARAVSCARPLRSARRSRIASASTSDSVALGNGELVIGGVSAAFGTRHTGDARPGCGLEASGPSALASGRKSDSAQPPRVSIARSPSSELVVRLAVPAGQGYHVNRCHRTRGRSLEGVVQRQPEGKQDRHRDRERELRSPGRRWRCDQPVRPWSFGSINKRSRHAVFPVFGGCCRGCSRRHRFPRRGAHRPIPLGHRNAGCASARSGRVSVDRDLERSIRAVLALRERLARKQLVSDVRSQRPVAVRHRWARLPARQDATRSPSRPEPAE